MDHNILYIGLRLLLLLHNNHNTMMVANFVLKYQDIA